MRFGPKTQNLGAAGRDPVSWGPAEAGALRVNQGEFRTLNGRGEVE